MHQDFVHPFLMRPLNAPTASVVDIINYNLPSKDGYAAVRDLYTYNPIRRKTFL